MSRLLGAAFAGGASSLAVVLATSSPSAHAEERRPAGIQQTLTSVAANLRVDSWRASGGGGGGDGSAWSVSKDTLHGGRQEGVDVITVDNGRLRFTVVPTRGMSLGSLAATGPPGSGGAVSVGWQSPVREVVHPTFVDLAQGGGLGWLTGFNEFLVRCGIAHAGHPGPDGGTLKTLHGRIGNVPASEVEVVVDADEPHTIRVRGRVDEQMFKFCDFELWTEVATVPGSDVLTVTDRLVNRSAYPKEFELIYHTNFGPGAGLEAGATFVAPTATVTPFNAEASADLLAVELRTTAAAKDKEEAWRTFLGPTRGFGERVYKVTTHADAATGNSIAALVSGAGDKGVALTYSAASLPCFTLWKNTDALEEGYVVGLEPGTSFCHPMPHERAHGRVPVLLPGGEQRFSLQVRVLRSASDVAEVRAEVDRLAAGRTPQVLELEP